MVVRVIASLLVIVSAYFYGYHQGQNSEELKHANLEISALNATIQEFKAKQTSDAVALAQLRVDESARRTELDRMRDQLLQLERKAKSDADRQRNRCLAFGIRCQDALERATRAIKYCAENHR